MSTTIDEKVVEMRFDGRDFEKNAQASISTLDKLKQSLKLDGAAKGFENVGVAANKLSLSGLTNAADAVAVKFSYMQSAIMHQFNKIVDGAVAAGKRVVSAFTTEPIKMGFQEYETQINAVQTILANTSSKGTTLDQVNAALDTLNAYADKTIYNFTEMTRNIGTFTAAGVDLDTATNAIQGIANLAAVSGSTSQQASTAMYQLSQALSSGTVKLQDWNSVVNAGMGGQVFQDALKETARVSGVAIDKMIEKHGSFRETLSEGWLTAEILTDTLQKFTLTTEGLTEAEIAQNREMLKSKGYTDDQIDAIFKLGETATDAATKVKTFSQLMDTLKEAAQSGWTQTWELLIGDFEEAKELWTAVSDYFGKAIGDSAEARNNLVKGWIDIGGRTQILNSVKYAFTGLLNVVKPIKDAFQEVFPPMTVNRLANISYKVERLSMAFKTFTEKHSDNIKKAFTGIFSAIDVGLTFVKSLGKGVLDLAKNFTGLSGGLLENAGRFGEWLTGLRDTVKETDIFGVAVEKVVGVVQNVIDKFKAFASAIAAKIHFPSLEDLRNVLSSIWGFVKNMASGIGGLLSEIGNGIGEFFSKTDMASVMKVLNGSILTGIFVKLSGLIKNGSGILETFKETLGGIKDMVLGLKEKKFGGGLIDALKDGLASLQEAVSVNKIIKIAVAVGILAVSLKTISTIDHDKISHALLALAVIFTELATMVAAFDKYGLSGVDKGFGALIGLAASVLILSSALKTLGDLDWGQIARGLTAMGGVLLELIGFTKYANSWNVDATLGVGLILIGASMKIFASTLEDLGNLGWEQIAKGIVAMGGVMLELIAFTNYAKAWNVDVGFATSLILIGASMKIFASTLEDLGNLEWGQIGKGLATMGGLLLEIAVFTRVIKGWNMDAQVGISLVLMASSLLIFGAAMKKFAEFGIGEAVQSLVMIGVLLAELAVALNFMQGTLGGSAALLIAAAALTVLVVPIAALSKIAWTSLAKSLIAIAGALTVVGIAGAAFGMVAPLILLGSVALAAMGAAMLLLVPTLAAFGAMKLGDIIKSVLGVAAAFVVLGGIAALLGAVSPLILAFGVAVLAVSAGVALFGAGLTAIGVGLSMIGGALEVFVTAVGNSAEALSANIAAIIEVIIQAISSIVDGIIELVPKFIEAGITILMSFLKGISDNIYQIVTMVGTIITEFLTALAEQLPKIVNAGMNLIVQFINGLAASLEAHGPQLATALWNLFVAAINTVLAFLTGGAVTNIKAAADKIMNSGFVRGLKDKANGVKTAFTTAISDAKTAVSNKVSEWTSIGKNMISGLIDGVKSMASSLVSAAKGVVSDAVQAAKNLLGIKSPSRVFAEMGRYVDEGFVVGMQAYAGRVVDATEDLGRSAVNSMSNVVKSISDVIEDNINAQPTIRPVLDLSNVESGAGRLNSMLSRTRAMSISASMNRGYDSEIQNGTATAGATFQFTQNNYSPKALSRLEIYRQTRNQLETLKGLART